MKNCNEIQKQTFQQVVRKSSVLKILDLYYFLKTLLRMRNRVLKALVIIFLGCFGMGLFFTELQSTDPPKGVWNSTLKEILSRLGKQRPEKQGSEVERQRLKFGKQRWFILNSAENAILELLQECYRILLAMQESEAKSLAKRLELEERRLRLREAQLNLEMEKLELEQDKLTFMRESLAFKKALNKKTKPPRPFFL